MVKQETMEALQKLKDEIRRKYRAEITGLTKIAS